MKAKIIIGGDVCPIGRNRDAFQKGDARAIFHDLLEEINSADLANANLESPCYDQGREEKKQRIFLETLFRSLRKGE